MATPKKKTAAKKSTPAKAKAKVKSAVKRVTKPVAKATPAPKKTTTGKSSASKASTKATHIPSGHEAKLAEQALKFVDEAASVLRSGIRSGAATTAQSRIAAKKKANALLDKASSSLSKAIGQSASTLQGLLGKL